NFGKILIGGDFASYNHREARRIARLLPNGTLDPTFTPGNGANDGTIWSLAIQPDDRILVGGGFTTFNDQPLSGVARLNADGTVDPSFNPGSGVFGTVSAGGVADIPGGGFEAGGGGGLSGFENRIHATA